MSLLYDLVVNHVDTHPLHPSIESSTRYMTYRELLQHMEKKEKKFTAAGLKTGDIVLLPCDDAFQYVMDYFSLLHCGAWIVPLSGSINRHELKSVGNQTKSNWLLHSDRLIHMTDDHCTRPDLPSCHGGVIQFTSGSTSRPKLCVRTIDALIFEGGSYQHTFQIKPEDNILCVPPLFHSFGQGAGMMASIVSGSSLHIVNRFVPREVLQISTRKNISILILVPAMAWMLSQTYRAHPSDLSSVRILLVGAGKISRILKDSFFTTFQLELMANYGSTETGAIISRLDSWDNDYIGKPMHGCEVKIVEETEEESVVGGAGRIGVKSPGTMLGYLDDSGQLSDPVNEGDFFMMRDIGSMDTHGHIYLKGRMDRMIVVGGRKVDPIQIEEVLLNCSMVRDCVVTKYMKANGELGVKAVLVSDERDEQRVRKYCAANLSSHMLPTVFEFRSKIPRNEMGKVQYAEL